jgi:putative FmdB family regulatory protein
MPTYEYECLSCGTHFDTFQKMSDLPLDKCIQCKGTVRRIVSGGSGLIFKGSGFYITDYAKGKGKKPENAKPSKEVSKAAASEKKSKKASSSKKK